MKLTTSLRHSFGHLGVKINSQIRYQLSPLEQPMFKGVLSKGLPNFMRRTREKFLYFAVPFFIGYLIYDWGEKKNAQLKRKNPADYETNE